MRITKILNNIRLCIKYPFLNTFNISYNKSNNLNLLLNKLRSKFNYRYRIQIIPDKMNETNIKKSEELPDYVQIRKALIFNNYGIKLDHDKENIIITKLSRNNKVISKRIFNYPGCNIKNVYFLQNNASIPALNWIRITIVTDNDNEYITTYKLYTNIYSLWTSNYMKICIQIITNIINCINTIYACRNIIPTYTKLDFLETGWKKAFGEDICKEIRHALLYTYINELGEHSKYEYIKAYIKGIKKVYKYHIDDIKEKYGSLRWYDSGTTEDVLKIIDKYEDISAKICVVCGKPAKYISKGWICPYCEEHIGNREKSEIKY